MSKKRSSRQTNPLEIKLNRVARTIIRRALREDMRNRGDITTRATVPPDKPGSAVIRTKQNGTIAGQAIAGEVFRTLDRSTRYDPLVPDANEAAPGTEIARIDGKMWAILAGERTALNILGRCSGIATAVKWYVEAVEGTNVKISETRKTAPGIRYLDKAAVVSGGGINHRCGLHDAFLIKENHIVAVGGIVEAIKACRNHAARFGRFRIMVEARNLDEYRQALSAQPDRILLDNMSPDEIRQCVEIEHMGTELEATGGIDLENVRSYAETGVDYISIGALTHSVKVLDLSLLVQPQ